MSTDLPQIVKTPARRPRGRPPGRMIKTRMHFRLIKGIFENPPEDYDGSNSKLAEYLNLSKRQVSRLLATMAELGYIEVRAQKLKNPGGFYTHREILMLPKIKEI